MFIQSKRDNRIDRKGIYYEDWLIMASKSHNLPFASWRLRKIDDVAQSEPKGLGTRRADAASSSLRTKEDNIPVRQEG